MWQIPTRAANPYVVPFFRRHPHPALPLQAFMHHTISIYGDAEGWNIAFYIFTGFRSLLFFIVIILLATGARRGTQAGGQSVAGRRVVGWGGT